jgi:hypothetical protein
MRKVNKTPTTVGETLSQRKFNYIMFLIIRRQITITNLYILCFI